MAELCLGGCGRPTCSASGLGRSGVRRPRGPERRDDARQPHEHTRVVQIVLFQVVGGRVVFDKCSRSGRPSSRPGSSVADLLDAIHTNIFPCTFRAGWPHPVVTSTSGRARPIASTAANVCPRCLSPSPSRADEVGLLGFIVLRSLRANREPSFRRPVAKGCVHEVYSPKVAEGQSIC